MKNLKKIINEISNVEQEVPYRDIKGQMKLPFVPDKKSNKEKLRDLLTNIFYFIQSPRQANTETETESESEMKSDQLDLTPKPNPKRNRFGRQDAESTHLPRQANQPAPKHRFGRQDDTIVPSTHPDLYRPQRINPPGHVEH